MHLTDFGQHLNNILSILLTDRPQLGPKRIAALDTIVYRSNSTCPLVFFMVLFVLVALLSQYTVVN